MQIQKILSPFVTEPNEYDYTRLLAAVRIAFGLTIFWRYLDLIGSAELVFDPYPEIPGQLIRGAVLGLFIACGVLTQVSLLLYLVLHIMFQAFAVNLGDQASAVVLWICLLTGSGRYFSLDQQFSKIPRFQKAVQTTYRFCVSPNALGIGQVRFLALFLYWSIALSAMIFHLGDEFWQDGKVLQVALTTPYITDVYPLMESWEQNSPWSFHWILKIGVYVQSFWEFFLIALFYNRWTRLFAIVQGSAFFFSKFYLFNLSFLPVYETLFWIFLLGFPSKRWMSLQTHKPDWTTITGPYLPLKGKIGAALMALICLLTNISALRIASTGQVLPLPSFVLRSLGQGYPNVFNKNEFFIGSSFFTLEETDDQWKFKRALPVMDQWGGRLSFLKNDINFYGLSLSWQRSSFQKRFDAKGSPSPYTIYIARTFARMDYCIQGAQGKKNYRARFFRVNPLQKENYTTWERKRHYVSRLDFSLEIPDPSIWCRWAFDLPPYHIGESRRHLELEDFLRQFVEPPKREDKSSSQSTTNSNATKNPK